MGFDMRQQDGKFTMPASKKQDALKAVKALDGKGLDLVWVKPGDMDHCRTLEEAMEVWGWGLEVDDDGNVTDIQFDSEKLGADNLLFRTLAPFVDDGSWIEMLGPEGEQWRWTFKDGKCKEVDAEIVWPDEDEDEDENEN